MDKDGICHVCGDKASGKHYGVPSCDGCRGFFKRSIRRNLEYTCKEGGKCLVNVTRRNQCQACRFAKCLRVNMKRDAVQHERVPKTNGASLDELSSLSPSSITWDFAVVPQNGTIYSTFTPYQTPYLISQNITRFQSNIFSNKSSNNFAENRPYGNENEVTSSEEILGSNEKNAVYAPFSVNYILSKDINECAAKLLIFTVKWSKTIPSFLQLTYKDQKILLTETWNELFILHAIQWSFSFYDNLLNCINHSQNKKLIDFQKKLKDITIRFQTLQVDYTEFACLKALTLFKPESQNLQDRFHIEILQDQTQMMLHEYCAFRQNHRFGKLLLLLKTVSCFECHITEELFFNEHLGSENSLVKNFIMEVLKQ